MDSPSAVNMNPIKGQRGFQSTQFCPKGHDKECTGRTTNGTCKICKTEYDKKWEKENPDKFKRMYNRSNWHKSAIKNLDGTFFTEIDYDRQYQIQQGKCFVCYTHQSLLQRPLNADHNHNTGFFRGLLCDNCNKGLGLFKDSIETLDAGIRYLRGY